MAYSKTHLNRVQMEYSKYGTNKASIIPPVRFGNVLYRDEWPGKFGTSKSRSGSIELGTACAQDKSKHAILLARLAFTSVWEAGFTGYSGSIVPQLFPQCAMSTSRNSTPCDASSATSMRPPSTSASWKRKGPVRSFATRRICSAELRTFR